MKANRDCLTGEKKKKKQNKKTPADQTSAKNFFKINK